MFRIYKKYRIFINILYLILNIIQKFYFKNIENIYKIKQFIIKYLFYKILIKNILFPKHIKGIRVIKNIYIHMQHATLKFHNPDKHQLHLKFQKLSTSLNRQLTKEKSSIA